MAIFFKRGTQRKYYGECLKELHVVYMKRCLITLR